MRFRHAAVVLSLLLLAGCAGGRGPRHDRDVIGAEEIAIVEPRTTARQLIERLRPAWLGDRGPSNLGDEAALPVYVNGQVIGDWPLERYTAGEIIEIRRLNAMAATQRFGTGHSRGAILLTVR
jgi:hypothetical protein